MITQATLQSLFDYQNGQFVRKSTNKPVVCNKIDGQAYLRLSIQNKTYILHRMIFLHQHGFLPNVIDHIDGDRFNNRIENLRAVTQQQNCLNSKRRNISQSGFKNVYLQTQTKKSNWKRNWVVSLAVEGKRKYIGSFDNLELADLVAQEARNKFHGAFARHF
jgi:hypothetical protein